MNKQVLIEKTIHAINFLPEEKATEIAAFAELIMKQYEELVISKGIQKIASIGETYSFLEGDEDIYTLNDLKQIYGAK